MDRRAVREVRVLSDRDRATLRAAPSYRVALAAVRLVGAGLAGAGLFAVVANLVDVPTPVIGVVGIAFALVVSVAAFVAAVNLTRLSRLRFNLRGRQLIDPMGKRQFYAMFMAEVARGRTGSFRRP